MTKEFEFLNIINNKLSNSNYLGDDCAYLKEYNLCVSSDSLIQDVHFKLEYMTPYEIAQKALLVNISDILASGSKPIYATINLSGQLENEFIEEFYSGVNDVINEYDMTIIGGDLTSSSKIMISVTVFGDAKKRNISSRKNAKNGYILATCGEFGSSKQGLLELLNNQKESYFIDYHKKPKLFKNVSNEIATKTKKPYAMMDSSDGLVDCLLQIAKKSNVRIDIDYSLIPKKIDNRDFVLYGGEDYSLVCALDEKDFNKINGLTKIGTCLSGEGVFVDGKEIEYKGFEHFD